MAEASRTPPPNRLLRLRPLFLAALMVLACFALLPPAIPGPVNAPGVIPLAAADSETQQPHSPPGGIGDSEQQIQSPDTAWIDNNDNCIPDRIESPPFTSFRIQHIADHADYHAAKVYCFPPTGVASDSLILWVYPVPDPRQVQFRLYTPQGTLVRVLPVIVDCPATSATNLTGITTPRKKYTLEVVASSVRFTRTVILGRP